MELIIDKLGEVCVAITFMIPAIHAFSQIMHSVMI